MKLSTFPNFCTECIPRLREALGAFDAFVLSWPIDVVILIETDWRDEACCAMSRWMSSFGVKADIPWRLENFGKVPSADAVRVVYRRRADPDD